MHYSGLTALSRWPELAPLLEGADHVDVKTVAGSVNMRTFVANMLGYQPGWVTALFRARTVVVRLLGIREQVRGSSRPSRRPLTPATVPMERGEPAAFFKVYLAREEEYWIAEAEESHLRALLGVLVEPVPHSRLRLFHVVTVVFYRHWTGPVYFTLIRPFHHLVVGNMARNGAGLSHTLR